MSINIFTVSSLEISWHFSIFSYHIYWNSLFPIISNDTMNNLVAKTLFTYLSFLRKYSRSGVTRLKKRMDIFKASYTHYQIPFQKCYISLYSHHQQMRCSAFLYPEHHRVLAFFFCFLFCGPIWICAFFVFCLNILLFSCICLYYFILLFLSFAP